MTQGAPGAQAPQAGEGLLRSGLIGRARHRLRRGLVSLVKALDSREDARFGIDASGRYDVLDLPTAERKEMYEAISGTTLKLLIGALNLKPDRFVFVDLGCGKGRPLCIASRFRFRRVIGVELSARLCEGARRNVQAMLAARDPVCPEVTVHHADAGAFALPDADLVVYLFNPFAQSVLQKVLDNISQRIDAGREVILIYHNPLFGWVVDADPRLSRSRVGNLFGLAHRILSVVPLAVYHSGPAPRRIGFWPDRAGLTGSRAMVGAYADTPAASDGRRSNEP